jgi:hypothetical protein
LTIQESLEEPPTNPSSPQGDLSERFEINEFDQIVGYAVQDEDGTTFYLAGDDSDIASSVDSDDEYQKHEKARRDQEEVEEEENEEENDHELYSEDE